MGERVTAGHLREILCVARKLRISAQEETGGEYAGLFLRAALALEERARELALHPFDPEAPAPDGEERRAALHRPVNIVC